uniref:Chitinase n=1 Tax=Helicoverpa armigera nucleopolyhedrovirus TaxID=51313 RepID=A0A482EQT2_9ABAC|nr:chitinase [Helicoverpa armigera nucleopolyhedrovirus]
MNNYCLYLFAFSILILHSYAAPPGVPTLDWADHSYALVQINHQATSYESLVNSQPFVTIKVSWSVWSGEQGEIAQVYLENKLDSKVINVWTGPTQDRFATFDYNTSGRYSMYVKLCNADGCSASQTVEVVIADTDGKHLKPLQYTWQENNKPYTYNTDHTVAAYFVEWGVYGRSFPVDKVPTPNLSHILYGFIPICGGDGINDSLKSITGSFEALQRSCAGRDNFKVSIHDPWAALQKPQTGVSAWNEPYKGNFGQLMAAKLANPNLKVLASIGGWTLSDPFYHMHDARTRQIFVESVREFVLTWKFFDGIDIDWEFPGGKGANPNVGDVERDNNTYIALLSELRAMLDQVQIQTNRTLELTTAISAGIDKIAAVNYDRAQQYLDKIFVMSYDFKGAWSNTDLGHQTALYGSAWKPNEPYTANVAVDALLAQRVNPKKLVLGVAMYGRGWTGVHNYDSDNPFSGVAVGPITGTWENGVVDYRQIAKNISRYEYAFDDVAKAAYVFDRASGDLISYDSERSVLAKGEYVLKRKLGGLFAWEIDADNGDLLNAMHVGLMKTNRNGLGTNSRLIHNEL